MTEHNDDLIWPTLAEHRFCSNIKPYLRCNVVGQKTKDKSNTSCVLQVTFSTGTKDHVDLNYVLDLFDFNFCSVDSIF